MPIFDQGYQHWNGPLSGHAWRWLAVARQGVRATLQGRVVRLLLLGAWMPAVGLVTVLATWGLLEQQAESVLTVLRRMLPADVIAQPQEYRKAVWTVAYSFFFKAELAGALFLVLVVGPNLISRDLRFNALPLYFSRPLRRFDYFLGKLGVIGFFLAATAIGPAVVAYLLGVAFSLDLGVVRDTHRLLWGGALYGLIVTLSAGTLMLALSSLSRRSIYVGLTWAGFCFLTLMLSGILLGVRYDAERQQGIYQDMTRWLRDHPPPPGIETVGPYPRNRGDTRWQLGDRPGLPPLSKEDQERFRWYRAYSDAYSLAYAQAEAARHDESRTDWRPVVSYATNLDRLGDWLLDADSAWVALGRTVERPRAAFGPAMRMPMGGRLPGMGGPANDRLLADRMVWQFPWYWSAAALGGLWLVSVFILTRRVKSLDRLK
jgi:ABC-2 type transport system permease protein